MNHLPVITTEVHSRPSPMAVFCPYKIPSWDESRGPVRLSSDPRSQIASSCVLKTYDLRIVYFVQPRSAEKIVTAPVYLSNLDFYQLSEARSRSYGHLR